MTKRTKATIIVEIVTRDGLAAWHHPGRSGYEKIQATPPESFGESVHNRVPVTIRHGGPVCGHLDYIEHSMGYSNGMVGVAVIENVDAELVDNKVFCSAEIIADAIARYHDTTEWVPAGPWATLHPRSSSKLVGSATATKAQLHAIALVDATAGITATKVKAYPGDYRIRSDRESWGRGVPDLIDRAAKAATPELRYHAPTMLRIHQPERHDGHIRNGGRPEIVHHGGGRVLAVRSA